MLTLAARLAVPLCMLIMVVENKISVILHYDSVSRASMAMGMGAPKSVFSEEIVIRVNDEVAVILHKCMILSIFGRDMFSVA